MSKVSISLLVYDSERDNYGALKNYRKLRVAENRKTSSLNRVDVFISFNVQIISSGKTARTRRAVSQFHMHARNFIQFRQVFCNILIIGLHRTHNSVNPENEIKLLCDTMRNTNYIQILKSWSPIDPHWRIKKRVISWATYYLLQTLMQFQYYFDGVSTNTSMVEELRIGMIW